MHRIQLVLKILASDVWNDFNVGILRPKANLSMQLDLQLTFQLLPEVAQNLLHLGARIRGQVLKSTPQVRTYDAAFAASLRPGSRAPSPPPAESARLARPFCSA